MQSIKDDIKNRHDEYLESQTILGTGNANRVEDFGHPCLAYLYNCRMNATLNRAPSIELVKHLMETEEQKLSVIRYLLGLGFKISEMDRHYSLPDLNIQVKIDGFISNNNEKMVFSILPLPPGAFQVLETINDFCNLSNIATVFKTQHTLTMALTHQNSTLIILKNMGFLDLKILEYDFDIVLYNDICKKIGIVNDSVANKEQPSPMDYTPKICDHCVFKDICGVITEKMGSYN